MAWSSEGTARPGGQGAASVSVKSLPSPSPFSFVRLPSHMLVETRLGSRRPGRRRRLGCAGPAPRRDHQRRLAGPRRRRHLPRRLPFLQPFPRRSRPRSQRPPRHAGRAAGQRTRLRPDPTLGAVRPPLRRDRRRRAAGRPGARRPVRLPARAPSGSSSASYLAGAVQDFVILFGSMRRDGKSLGQMAKEETGPFAGAPRDGRPSSRSWSSCSRCWRWWW